MKWEMVVIINGEIVPDNDPRALAKRGGNQTGQQASQRQTQGSRIVSFGDINSGAQRQQGQRGGNSGGNAQGPTGPHDDDVDGLLTPFSRVLGIQGNRLHLPPIPRLNFTGYSFPLVHVVASLLVMLVMGNWRYSIVAFIALSILNPK